ncbi:hypothetical protein TRVA0_026S00584 [Trichomonascus vanleenenianus]|uniref:copper transporter family protein n=1 Tax=Trichomonascus vanleenenianus TaxID=2268995 RepID=UPI003ECB9E88
MDLFRRHEMMMDMGSSTMASMDMGTSTMASKTMSMLSSAATAAAAATSLASSSMAGMDMGGSSGDQAACKMQMYWNWFTIDACFLAKSWHITSRGMFAGTCIGVIFLVMALEFVRRAQREYDRMIVQQWKERQAALQTSESSSLENNASKTVVPGISMRISDRIHLSNKNSPTFKPTFFQQIIRALFYMIQLGGGYIVMLLVMYYNGYIFFCILIGGLLGFFFFGSDNITDGLHQESLHACC